MSDHLDCQLYIKQLLDLLPDFVFACNSRFYIQLFTGVLLHGRDNFGIFDLAPFHLCEEQVELYHHL